MDERVHSFAAFLKKKFPGQMVRKIPIDAGFTCPNRDGTLGRDGCVFCDPHAAGPLATAGWAIERQIELRLRRAPATSYIAYFQANCNTHGAPGELRRRYEAALGRPRIVGLAVATRPDALPAPVLELLQEMAGRTWLSVELGLQSIHEASLAWLRRRHTYAQFLSAFVELRRRGIDVVVHLIVGIPGETRADMRATVAAMNELRPAGVKFHLLHVLRGAELQARHERGELPLLSREEYVDIMCDLLERLAPGIVVHRLAVDREAGMFVAPGWARDKAAVLRALAVEMRRRGACQGRLAEPCR
jgi:hypothetical protein